ncbi:MAG: hypothetical protein ABIQ72_04755 [Usitatibacter sp.]
MDTDESEKRLAPLHDNVKKFGTVFNTVSPGTELSGTLRRRAAELAPREVIDNRFPLCKLVVITGFDKGAASWRNARKPLIR